MRPLKSAPKAAPAGAAPAQVEGGAVEPMGKVGTLIKTKRYHEDIRDLSINITFIDVFTCMFFF